MKPITDQQLVTIANFIKKGYRVVCYKLADGRVRVRMRSRAEWPKPGVNPFWVLVDVEPGGVYSQTSDADLELK